MTDPGLSNRLRQHSRRAGLMVGISMAFTIAVCIGGFAAIYAGLIPWVSDLVPIEAPAATQAPAEAALNPPPRPAATTAPADEIAAAPTPTPAPAPTATAAFQPTHQIRADQSVNLRPKPSSENTPDNQPIVALPPQTPLQYLNQDQPADNPNDAPRWMRFRTQDGQEGWIRQIDVAQYQP